MKYVSFSLIITLIAVAYTVHTIWTLAEIFIPPECNRGEKCYSSYIIKKPIQHLVIYSSVNENPYAYDESNDGVKKVHTAMKFDYESSSTFDINLRLPSSTRRNGTLFLHAALIDEDLLYRDFLDLRRSEPMYTLPLVTHIEPQVATYNLLQDGKVKTKKVDHTRPFAHISTFVPLSILTDKIKLPAMKIPGELYPYIRLRNGMFLPIINHNVLKSRISHLSLINSTMKDVNITISVSPTSYGSMRLGLHVKLALDHLKALGFSEKDVDDVKGIFADTNLYLLSATVLIASCHLLFDFLAFKNDVSFWRSKRSYAGLSPRTVLWRAFSQMVILLYLIDEQTSLLVVVPAAISAVIELWKVTKVFHVRIQWRGGIRIYRESRDAAELGTARADAEAMRYLAMLLYPLCAAVAVYSLIYDAHKSWYSWALHSVVTGVYAFGFLLMLPQLFVNYRLRSVAALPWRAFMYKAFNTFIDDVFAFVITMPAAHRVACFRDDLVFLVYLYQRWLYPVDKSRVDTAVSMDETTEEPQKEKLQ